MLIYLLPDKTTGAVKKVFDALTQWDAYKLASHISSAARASLNGLTPFRLAQMLLGTDALDVFRLREIDADCVCLIPELMKQVEFTFSIKRGCLLDILFFL